MGWEPSGWVGGGKKGCHKLGEEGYLGPQIWKLLVERTLALAEGFLIVWRRWALLAP